MSPLSRNPRDATIQLRDIQRWGRCRGLLRGRSHGRHVHRPSLDRWLALTGISFGWLLLCPPVRGPCGPLRGYGLVRSRRPEQSLASCPRSRRPRGCGLVRSRCPEQLLASCPGSRRLRGCGLVWSRCPDQLLASCPGAVVPVVVVWSGVDVLTDSLPVVRGVVVGVVTILYGVDVLSMA